MTGEPKWVASSLVRGMETMPLTWDGVDGRRRHGAPTTFAELVLSRAGDDGDGLLYEDQRWSWREVVGEARVRADLLLRRRRPGPFHVGVLLENVPEFVFLLTGAGIAGAAVVGINPTRRGAELARDINHTDCQLIITDASMRPLLDGIPLDLTLPNAHPRHRRPGVRRGARGLDGGRCARRAAPLSALAAPIPRRCSRCCSPRAPPARPRPCG